MKKIKIIITFVLTAVAVVASAQRTFDLQLWAGRTPNDNGDIRDTAKVRVFLPNEKTATGRAVVICPGGGYETLSMDKEGYDWASFFNNMGIAVIVLKYRMPHGEYQVPVSDAEAAIRLVRANARNWHIKLNEVGIMGFSAGGHLASVIATSARGDAKPDFQILFYPVITMMPDFTHKGTHDNFLGKHPSKKKESEYSTDIQVSRVTPRAFIALSDDDHVVAPANGFNYYLELYRHDVPAALHIYPDGGHGWGIGREFKYSIEMQMELKAWLNSF